MSELRLCNNVIEFFLLDTYRIKNKRMSFDLRHIRRVLLSTIALGGRLEVINKYFSHVFGREQNEKSTDRNGESVVFFFLRLSNELFCPINK